MAFGSVGVPGKNDKFAAKGEVIKFPFMQKVNIRTMLLSEKAILEELLYEAIFQPEDAPRLPKEIIKRAEIWVYIDDFGTEKDDYCLVAERNGQILGAAWVRVLDGEIKGYGNVDAQTPELAIAVFPSYRKQGIGTRLIRKIIHDLRERGYDQLSLSVDKINYAVKMYRKLGFEIVREQEHDYIMVLKLADNIRGC